MRHPTVVEDAVLRHHEVGAQRTLDAFRAVVSKSDAARADQWSDGFLRSAILPTATSFRERQFQAYLFDTLVLRLGTHPEDPKALFSRRSALARQLGFDCFFDAYCAARGIDPEGILTTATSLLDGTDEAYHARFAALFGSRLTEERLSALYADVLTDAPERYTVEHIVSDLTAAVAELGCSGCIEIHRGSRSGVSTNVATIRPRTATIFVAEAPGLESYRAGCHALGHALFAVNPEVGDHDLLGVNIAATEVAAFAAQELALAQEPEHTREFLEFMPLYYARLYALRLLHEARFYRGEQQVNESYVRRCVERMGLVAGHDFRPARCITAADFVLAFLGYLDLRTPPDRWREIRSVMSSNSELLWRYSCTAHDLA